MSERARSPTLRHPQATSFSMLDGAVTAVVVGPVSMAPEEWVCPLLGVDPDAFNHDTEEFSAIAATLIRHNAIGEALSTRPESFEPLFLRSDGEVDAQPWCVGFYAVMKLRPLAWSRLISPDRSEHHLILPILFDGVDDADRSAMPLATPRCASNAWRDIPATVETLGQFWMPIVNRRRKVTPDRRPKLTPLVKGSDGSARPGGAGRGCAAGASAVR